MEFNNIKITMPLESLKYIGILLCFLISIIMEGKGLNSLDTKLLQFGMFFTVLADLFLVLLNYYFLGVLSFCIVQMIYIARYGGIKFFSIFKKLIIVFIFIFIIFFLIKRYIIDLDYIIPLVFFYSICLFISMLKAIDGMKNNIYPYPNKYMIVGGMILFTLGDINVALAYMEILYNISSNLIWVFYLPSQILLSLSGYDFKNKL